MVAPSTGIVSPPEPSSVETAAMCSSGASPLPGSDTNHPTGACPKACLGSFTGETSQPGVIKLPGDGDCRPGC